MISRADEADVVAWKYANALFRDAEMSGLAEGLLPAGGRSAIAGMKRKMGGLWVGGRVSLSREALVFAPNALNSAAHAGEVSWSVPLSRVAEVSDRFGWFTRIVDVATEDRAVVTFRCFGAPAFAEQIRRAAAARRAGS